MKLRIIDTISKMNMNRVYEAFKQWRSCETMRKGEKHKKTHEDQNKSIPDARQEENQSD